MICSGSRRTELGSRVPRHSQGTLGDRSGGRSSVLWPSKGGLAELRMVPPLPHPGSASSDFRVCCKD